MFKSKVIFFDIYQTLLDVRLSADNPNHEIEGWNAFAKSLLEYNKKINGLEFQNLCIKRRNDFYSDKDKEIHHHNLLKLVSDVLKKDLKIELTEQETTDLIYVYRKASRGHLSLYPGVFNALYSLSKQYILSTASHTQGSFTQIELNELGIEKFFSYFIYSSDIGFRKESSEFYKKALEIVGEKAENCVMVGDNYDIDVLVPKKLGIQGVWIENHLTSGRFSDSVNKCPPQNTIKIENFEKLPDLINRITK